MKYSKETLKIDERYFDGVRKGTRGRGAARKVVVFGMLKRHARCILGNTIFSCAGGIDLIESQREISIFDHRR